MEQADYSKNNMLRFKEWIDGSNPRSGLASFFLFVVCICAFSCGIKSK